MSQVRVQGNASGTGVLTVTSPNTNSNYTLTLPAQTGTLLSTASAGTVLQVVSASQGTSNASTSSSTYSDVLTISITPSSSTSKILVLANAWAGCTRNGDQLYVSGRIERRISGGSTTVITPSNQQQGTAEYYNHYRYTPNVATSVITYRMVLNQLDAPATSSAITYAWQHAAVGSVATNQTSGVEFVLLEIAA